MQIDLKFAFQKQYARVKNRKRGLSMNNFDTYLIILVFNQNMQLVWKLSTAYNQMSIPISTSLAQLI